MSRDEFVIVEMRIITIDAVNLSELAGTQRFVLIKAPKSFEQALATKHFMQSCNTAAEAICGIEKGGVAVGHFDTQTQ